jgi:transposase
MTDTQALIEELRRQNHALRSENETLRAQVGNLQQDLELTKRKLQHVLKQLFGKKSESLDARQLEMVLSGVEIQATALVPPPVALRPPRPARGRCSPRKPRIPENLPTEDVVIDPDEVSADPQAYQCIGEEITQELDVVPPKYYRRRFIRRKFVRKADRSLPPVIARLPPRLIVGGYAGIGLITDIALKKYLDHLPLYRQEQILKMRHGIELSRKTMSDWMDQLAWWLKPIYQQVGLKLRLDDYLQIDETPVRYCQAEGGGSGLGYLWVYHRPGGGVLFEWHTSRGADCLKSMLEDFGGTIQTDGYGAYESYVKKRLKMIAEGADKPVIVPAACWAHARRKFNEALAECPVQAGWLMRQIQHLYHIEAELRGIGAGPALREAVRSSQSMPILRRIEKVLRLKLAAHRPTSQMGRAIGYTLPLWKQLLVYVRDGRIEIDNNLVENAIRPTAVGKKNYLFFGHPEAGERSAIIYTLLENCKRERINPQEYLQDVLTRRLTTPLDQIAQLTPANWAAARKAKAA